ncbi:endonuclease/exonuclease/phosphatase family protein [Sulfurovum sp. zt1-1]|uniref:Endonuclease/exonuclease/phosphatase family protein n=1 Tax=Sulfurovum zhangzhouensis TaxID=3019067 RepID=A0ABT7QVC8_9BACT|nr:endonuclease/exonuclease/phosphatase family protein [Sulfurovum zhangzhouensis]MDM5270800.1 endonuclease/exonuclease/phosphatase family protein [Sulfurovum zhangzhouensis]
MIIRVGTFNLNNLFSRFNFQANIDEIPNGEAGGIELTFEQNEFSVRTFMGRLVHSKSVVDTVKIARRITDVMNADVLAVQEVEHIEILKQFNKEYLHDLYPYIALVEGNDPRLIDVAVMSKLPIGTIVSHQTAIHPDSPHKRVFGRDLLQVEILDHNREKLFTLYNTHLKSHFVPHDQDPIEGAKNANNRRKQQAEIISQIISKMERPNSRFILTGDMNDPPYSEFLSPMLTVDDLPLVNALANPAETRPPKAETPGHGPGPQTSAWTHRFIPPRPDLPQYELFDQIWVSQALADRFVNPTIDRRTTHGGDGSDHDPAWIDLNL